MPTNPRQRWFYPWVPIGIAAALGALVVWLLLFGPAGRFAQAGEPQLEAPAGVETPGKKLLVSVTLINNDTAALKGGLLADLLGPEGKAVDRLEKSVNQRD